MILTNPYHHDALFLKRKQLSTSARRLEKVQHVKHRITPRACETERRVSRVAQERDSLLALSECRPKNWIARAKIHNSGSLAFCYAK